MNYSIIGSGKLGMALARQFARNGISVGLANRRGPDTLAAVAGELGETVTPLSLEEAIKADVVILAIPFAAYKDVAASAATWEGKLVIDAMNARDETPEDLGHLESTDAVALALPGATLVKTFNQLPAASLASDPSNNGARRVMFVSGNDDAANARVAELVRQLGFAPIVLGKIAEGGKLLRYRGPLVLQKLFKQE